VQSNKSKGFRPVRFVSAFGSWVSVQSAEILFSTLCCLNKRGQ